MRISVLHRITSFTLAILMLCTSVGFSADLHFCNDELKSFSLFGKAESCHTAKKSCPHHANMVVSDNAEKNCCSNQSIEIDDLDADFNISADVKLTEIQVKFVASFVFSLFSLSLPSVVKFDFLESHDLLPPKDIYVLLERFLI